MGLHPLVDRVNLSKSNPKTRGHIGSPRNECSLAPPADDGDWQPIDVPGAVCKALKAECDMAPTAFVLVSLDSTGHTSVHTSANISHNRSAAPVEQMRKLFQQICETEGISTSSSTASCAETRLEGVPRQATPDEADASYSAKSFNQPRALRRRKTLKRTASQGKAPRKRRNPGISKETTSHVAEFAALNSDSLFKPAFITPTFIIHINDQAQVTAFFRESLEQFRQLGLKTVLKAWIKAIEPRKQVKYPYNSSDKRRDGRVRQAEGQLGPDEANAARAPPWWPSQVRHKGPDHLSKEGRLILAITILRLRRGKDQMWTDMLEDSTKCCNLRTSDQEAEECIRRRWRILQDLYRVARLEENFEAGGTDEGTVVTVESIQPAKRQPRSSRRAVPGATDDCEAEDSGFEQARDADDTANSGQVELVTPTARLQLRDSDDVCEGKSDLESWSNWYDSDATQASAINLRDNRPARMNNGFDQSWIHHRALESARSLPDWHTIPARERRYEYEWNSKANAHPEAFSRFGNCSIRGYAHPTLQPVQSEWQLESSEAIYSPPPSAGFTSSNVARFPPLDVRTITDNNDYSFVKPDSCFTPSSMPFHVASTQSVAESCQSSFDCQVYSQPSLSEFADVDGNVQPIYEETYGAPAAMQGDGTVERGRLTHVVPNTPY